MKYDPAFNNNHIHVVMQSRDEDTPAWISLTHSVHVTTTYSMSTAADLFLEINCPSPVVDDGGEKTRSDGNLAPPGQNKLPYDPSESIASVSCGVVSRPYQTNCHGAIKLGFINSWPKSTGGVLVKYSE